MSSHASSPLLGSDLGGRVGRCAAAALGWGRSGGDGGGGRRRRCSGSGGGGGGLRERFLGGRKR